MVALSTSEAEYIAFIEGVKEAIWLGDMIEESEVTQESLKINLYNEIVIHVDNHQLYHERTKHVDICLQF